MHLSSTSVSCSRVIAIGFSWLVLSGRLHRHESRRFAFSLDETRPISVVNRVAPEEFSDEVAATTPIRLPSVTVPDLASDPRRPAAERLDDGECLDDECEASRDRLIDGRRDNRG